jgi:hypothetical protein
MRRQWAVGRVAWLSAPIRKWRDVFRIAWRRIPVETGADVLARPSGMLLVRLGMQDECHRIDTSPLPLREGVNKLA